MKKTLRPVTGQPNRKRKVSAYIDRNYFNTVQDEARTSGTSTGDVIRRAVATYFERI
jgi:hypothetical protein